MKFAVAAIVGGIAMVGQGAWAADAVQKAPDAVRGQKIAAQVCAACHGADGNSAIAGNPHLAGQHPEYVVKQLNDFKANKERKNPVMMGMATPLSAEDMRDVAAYYASQKPKGGAAKSKDLVGAGQKLYRGGNAATGLPACAACHGPNGAGMPSQYPRLSGQLADYTAGQLKAFRSGERLNDANQMMRMVALRMTDAEIAAVAEYIAGLR